MIAAVSGVVLSPEDARDLVGALDFLAQLLGERRSQPSPRLARLMSQLKRATRQCGAFNTNDTQPTQNATNGAGSQADQADPVHHLGYATVTTAQAADALGVRPGAVRAMAQRDPSKLGSVRIRGRWHHSAERVQERRAKKSGGRYLVNASPHQGVTNVVSRADAVRQPTNR